MNKIGNVLAGVGAAIGRIGAAAASLGVGAAIGRIGPAAPLGAGLAVREIELNDQFPKNGSTLKADQSSTDKNAEAEEDGNATFGDFAVESILIDNRKENGLDTLIEKGIPDPGKYADKELDENSSFRKLYYALKRTVDFVNYTRNDAVRSALKKYQFTDGQMIALLMITFDHMKPPYIDLYSSISKTLSERCGVRGIEVFILNLISAVQELPLYRSIDRSHNFYTIVASSSTTLLRVGNTIEWDVVVGHVTTLLLDEKIKHLKDAIDNSEEIIRKEDIQSRVYLITFKGDFKAHDLSEFSVQGMTQKVLFERVKFKVVNIYESEDVTRIEAAVEDSKFFDGDGLTEYKKKLSELLQKRNKDDDNKKESPLKYFEKLEKFYPLKREISALKKESTFNTNINILESLYNDGTLDEYKLSQSEAFSLIMYLDNSRNIITTLNTGVDPNNIVDDDDDNGNDNDVDDDDGNDDIDDDDDDDDFYNNNNNNNEDEDDEEEDDDESIKDIIDDAMVKRDNPSLEKCKMHILYMLSCIRKLEKINTKPIYTEPVQKLEEDKYKIGYTFVWPTFKITSGTMEKMDDAQHFYVFEITGDYIGYDISRFITYPKEGNTIILEPESGFTVIDVVKKENYTLIKLEAVKSNILLKETIDKVRDYIQTLSISNLDNIIPPNVIIKNLDFLDEMTLTGKRLALEILKPIVYDNLLCKENVSTVKALIMVIHRIPVSKPWCKLQIELSTRLKELYYKFSLERVEKKDISIFCGLLKYILTIATKKLSVLSRVEVKVRLKYGNINNVQTALSWMKSVANKISAVSKQKSFYYDANCLKSYSSDTFLFNIYTENNFSYSVLSSDYIDGFHISYRLFNPVILYKSGTLSEDDRLLINNSGLRECETEVMGEENIIYVLVATGIEIFDCLKGRGFKPAQQSSTREPLENVLRRLGRDKVILCTSIFESDDKLISFSLIPTGKVPEKKYAYTQPLGTQYRHQPTMAQYHHYSQPSQYNFPQYQQQHQQPVITPQQSYQCQQSQITPQQPYQHQQSQITPQQSYQHQQSQITPQQPYQHQQSQTQPLATQNKNITNVDAPIKENYTPIDYKSFLPSTSDVSQSVTQQTLPQASTTRKKPFVPPPISPEIFIKKKSTQPFKPPPFVMRTKKKKK